MLATSTHDNKRSEDVRARIDAISEMPAAWRLLVRRWARINRSRKRVIEGRPAPSRNDEYLLYQTLIGSFPTDELDAETLGSYRERIQQYMIKAAREAKIHTSWMSIDREYEDALTEFVGALLAGPDGNLFIDELRNQRNAFAWFGLLNSLSMALIKFASPGVPDIYQGNELLDLSLVDPDNRRPVDYALRREFLASLETLASRPADTVAAGVRELFDRPYDGRAKMWVTFRSLRLRKDRRDLFAEGDYQPIKSRGPQADNVVAFARRHRRQGVIAVAPRLVASLGVAPGVLPLGNATWTDSELEFEGIPRGTTLTDVLTGTSLTIDSGRVSLARIFSHFPGALLHYVIPA